MPKRHHRLAPGPGRRHRTREEATKRTPYDSTWRRLRYAVLSADPWCRMCGKLAREVDHIIPLRVRPDLRLVESNLQPLCVTCHRSKKAREENRRYRT